MKNTVDLRAFVGIPATIVGGEKMSAVLDPDSEFGVAEILKYNFAISQGEAVDIARWLVFNSGRGAKFFEMDWKWHWGKSDTAMREAVVGAWQSLCSIELTA